MNKLTDEMVFENIKYYLRSARKKHPFWVNDIIHGSAIIAEESGELTKESLQIIYEKGSVEKCRTKAFHVMVTAIRFLTETKF